MDEWNGLFDWDEGNESHIAKHGFRPDEVEEALLDPDQISTDAYNVGAERRDAIIGKTDGGSIVFVVYTMRGGQARPISIREAERNEKRRYRQ